MFEGLWDAPHVVIGLLAAFFGYLVILGAEGQAIHLVRQRALVGRYARAAWKLWLVQLGLVAALVGLVIIDRIGFSLAFATPVFVIVIGLLMYVGVACWWLSFMLILDARDQLRTALAGQKDR